MAAAGLSSQQTPDKTAEKRRAVLEEAIRAFARQGFRGTDVQLIADGAGVGKGTVYRHFGNKEDLFWAATFEVFQRLEQELLGAMGAAAGVLPKLRAAGLAFGDFFDRNPDYLEIFVHDRAEFRGTAPEEYQQHHEQLTDRFVKIIQEGMEAGEVRHVDARRTTLALAGVLYGVVLHSCYVRHGYTLREQIEHAVDIFLQGIRR